MLRCGQSMIGHLARLAKGLTALAWPPVCVGCGAPGEGGLDLCAGCRADLPWIDVGCRRCGLPLPASGVGVCGACLRRPPPFDTAVIPLMYAPPVDRWIQDLKFHARLSLVPLLGALLAGRLEEAGALPRCVVPVPLHRERLRTRGFNQAVEIGRALRRRLGVDLDCRGVRRVRATPAQVGADLRTRRRNVRGAFAARGDFAGMHVAVLDDVVTTGATTAELARVLRRAGAARVDLWAVARTRPHKA